MRIRFAGIVAVLVMLTAACDGDGHSPKPSGSTPPSSPPTTAISTAPTGPQTTGPGVLPGEKPPVLSEAAKQHNSAGALAFGSYYFNALDWSTATTDPYLVHEISASSCQACGRAIRGLNTLRHKGGYVRGGRISLVSARLVTGTFKVASDFVVQTAVDEQPVVLVQPSGPPTTSAPAVKNDVSLVFVSWSTGHWRVVEVGAPS